MTDELKRAAIDDLTKLRASIETCQRTIAACDSAADHYKRSRRQVDQVHAHNAIAAGNRARAELAILLGEADAVLAMHEAA